MTPFLVPLDADALRAADIPAPWSYGFSDRVRFGEIDVLGHVNNAAYLRWFENLRINYFQDYGLFDYATKPPKLVLRSLGLSFHREVKMNDPYILTGRTVEMRASSFTMNYGVWVNGQLTTTGDAVIVSLNNDNSKRPLTDDLKNSLRDRDGAVQA
ncbi:acyl-CoA thioester hydrolase [Cognatiyoonia koreensis]|uniref:Acyl-CoA thioester hydrolase n=1 Tax=Cognatiyoonia koreensis TaxID=364200 RepID=A0A1I0PGQ0_9RHOB|nr:thioesterase family protein [Cognatiyoonia koreensis]SEW13546.1 acyl-CoA thioester hydrolase [Cognatiyoonia koreensis]